MLVAAADGAILAGPLGATLPIVDGSEWSPPESKTGFRKRIIWKCALMTRTRRPSVRWLLQQSCTLTTRVLMTVSTMCAGRKSATTGYEKESCYSRRFSLTLIRISEIMIW
jgi:hypothetical protein